MSDDRPATPRPWKVELENQGIRGRRENITIVVSRGLAGRGVICRVGDTSMSGALADAELIVRTVNSFDALVAALRAVLNSDMAMREEDEGQTSDTLALVRAALTKAGNT